VLIDKSMVRQADRIEKALHSSIKQFYVTLHGHLSVSPLVSGMALQTLRSAKLMGWLRFA